ncbi:MAG: ADP-forming succinate--CoA ligase subunit beta [Bacteroidales bacterium]|nr:ADP-forming succinate--CoA ligase subunit beta [Bacteroidales bacterium]
MNIHEFQAKNILEGYGAKIPLGLVAETPQKAVKAVKAVQEKTGTKTWVVKAQVHAGGRGKGGGVKLATSPYEVETLASKIIGMNLVTPQTGSVGKKVSRVLIQQDIYYPGEEAVKEYYLSFVLNRSSGKNTLVYSTKGGTDIEEVAANTPHLVLKEEIDPVLGLQAFQARRVAFGLGLSGKAYSEMVQFLLSVYKAYTGSDALLIEINPVVKTSDGHIMAADAKMIIDDNALFRHPEIMAMRDTAEEDPAEVEASEHNLNFVKLDGNVGCMVNGAGLAMATMDIIKLSGGSPANFLDVGGSANAQTVEAGFRIILKDPHVKAILINIFGGIVRCDRVAEGIIEAYKAIGEIRVPVIVRLQGTNAEIAKELIDKSGLKVLSAITLFDAARKVKEVFD